MNPTINHKEHTIDDEECFIYLTHFKSKGELFLNEACYSYLFDEDWYINPDLTMYIFRLSKAQKDYVQYVIKYSKWAKFFTTKSATTGFKSGFKINTKIVTESNYQEGNHHLLDALRFLRLTNEFAEYITETKDFHKYVSQVKNLRTTAAGHIQAWGHFPNKLEEIY